MPAVSVIIPVYKCEKYLRRCLDSLLHQDFAEWQAICIDDGSPDNSGKILDEYAAQDSRFIVVHKKYAGVSAARNDGIKKATGKYIHFLDADDFVDDGYYQKMFQSAEQNNADMVVSGLVSDNKYTKPIIYKKGQVLKSIAEKTKYTFVLTDSYVWRYLFKTDFIKKYKLKFNTKLIAQEDTLFVLDAITVANVIITVPDVLYHYMFNADSALNSRDATHHAKVKMQYKIGKQYRKQFAKKHKLMHLWRMRKLIKLFR